MLVMKSTVRSVHVAALEKFCPALDDDDELWFVVLILLDLDMQGADGKQQQSVKRSSMDSHGHLHRCILTIHPRIHWYGMVWYG